MAKYENSCWIGTYKAVAHAHVAFYISVNRDLFCHIYAIDVDVEDDDRVDVDVIGINGF